jgi:response regulator RpfG family c-di-GMP phosphodiesterase
LRHDQGPESRACYRDDETGDHVLRIGKTACLMAEAIGMPSNGVT